MSTDVRTAPVALAAPPVVAASAERSKSQRDALRSTSIIGGSTVVVLAIRTVRTKVLALLLGPTGIGIESLYDAVITMTRSVTEVGIGNAGVRQIAAAVGTNDQHRVAATVFTLRRTSLVLGLVGAAVLLLAREPISRLALGDTAHAAAIGWLGLALFFGAINTAQGALLQGVRRIRDLAMMNIVGTAVGAAVSIPVVLLWGAAGIPAYMILGAAGALVISWWYARRVRMPPAHLTSAGVAYEAGGLLKLGLAFVASGLLSTGAQFALRALVGAHAGLAAVGQFQAANALSSVYVGFILQAMGTDFYPRLTAVAERNAACNVTVNEQVEISLLLAVPGILGSLAAAPWAVQLFYSRQFGPAADILSWQLVGMLLRVVSWPMGFIMLAKGRGVLLVLTDLAAYATYVALGWLGLRRFGLPGVGAAFLGLYAFHALLTYAVARRLSDFRWSAANRRWIGLTLGSAAVALALRLTLPEPWATAITGLFAAGVGILCARSLIALIGPAEVRRYGRKLPFVRRFFVSDPVVS